MQSDALRTSTGPTVAFETLGCKLNQYETDAIATELDRRNFRIVEDAEGADAYIINTCTVTNKADRKSRNTLNRAVRRAGRDGVVVLTGCFVDSNREVLEESGATYVVDNARKNAIPEILEAHFRGEIIDPNALASDVFGYAAPSRIFHTRTNIKIQDGCDNYCTFCIIPFVRGRARSRRSGAIIDEARDAIRGGARELVLTGVNMSRYRYEEADRVVTFVDIVEAILDLDGEFRVRISSLEPDGLDERFVALFSHPKMCPHLHLCLQSGSDRILLAMRRMYSVAQYRSIAGKLRALIPDFNITTDLIVGFPGETEDDFQRSAQLVEEVMVGHVHMFPYSVRAGTRACRMKGHVASREKARRGRYIQEEAERRKLNVRRALVGGTQTVLVEHIRRTATAVHATGFGEHYVPVRIIAPPTADIEHNRFYCTRITGVDEENTLDLVGTLS